MDHTLATTATTASLLLDGGGRLPRYDLLDCTARAALLVDLGLAGRVVQRADCIEIDPSASGVRLLDDLLGAVVADPRTTLDGLVATGPVSLADVGRHLTTTGTWSARGAGPFRRRFDVVDPTVVHLRRLSSNSLRRAAPDAWWLLDASGVALRPPVPRGARPARRVIWPGSSRRSRTPCGRSAGRTRSGGGCCA